MYNAKNSSLKRACVYNFCYVCCALAFLWPCYVIKTWNVPCFVQENRTWSLAWNEKIFKVQCDTYLSDALSCTSPSCHIACGWLALNEAWLCLEQNNFFLTQQVTLHLHAMQHAGDHNYDFFAKYL